MKVIILILGTMVVAGALFVIFNPDTILDGAEKINVAKEVVVYVSEDQVFSEPVLKDFEKETGIKVKAVYDTEESKGTGVMNRLIAEKNNTRADVYWANEPIRAEVLKQKGITAPYMSPNSATIPAVFKDSDHHWTGFSARARVLIVNKKIQNMPSSIMDYTVPEFKNRAVIANPLFGTTTSHISALFTVWGDAKTKTFLNNLKSNETAIATSNGESADFVAQGRYAFSLVDSDDAINRLRRGEPVKLIYPDQKQDEPGCFIVPNTVMLIKNAPHAAPAKQLIDFLLSKETEKKLALADCAQIPLHKGVEAPKELKPVSKIKVMEVNYALIAKKMVEVSPFLKEWAGL